MRSTFRAKLSGIVLVAAMGSIVMISTGAAFSAQVEARLALIREEYLPRLELGPRLNQEFERLRHAMQDAVAAQDEDVLAATSKQYAELRALLPAAVSNDRAKLAEVGAAIDAYYEAARDVSLRMIRGESGEALLESMSAMQAKQLRAIEALRTTTTVDQRALAVAFASVSETGALAARAQLWLSIACFVLVLGLSLLISRGLVRSVSLLTHGFERFGAGHWTEPIALRSRDELGLLAQRANEMAASLARLHEDRDRNDWVRSGHALLSRELQGELEPEELTRIALGFFTTYLPAVAAALYRVRPDGSAYAWGPAAIGGKPSATLPSFATGEGLIGQAAMQTELRVIDEVPAGYLPLRSGLGEAPAGVLALLPLLHAGKVVAVLELAFWKPWVPLHGELLLAVRETLARAIEVASSRTALRELLERTQSQAERLAIQEEELRSTNEELQAQQEELRIANDELRVQAAELERRQRELEQSNSELDALRRGLEHKAEELNAVSTYKSQFLANMSHELRTPLNSMLLLSNLLSENESGNLSPKQVEYCKTIHGAGRDLLSLINQVLDLAKIEAGKQDVNAAACSLQELVIHARRLAEPLARDKALTFDADLEPGTPETIVTDRAKLEQILNNLIGNAIKFTERGTVSLRIARAAPGTPFTRSELSGARVVAIEVSDTGIGIAPEHQSAVFAPFEQVDGRANRRYGGTGLGLAIARELAALLGGELTLRSQPGLGSTFVCYLPEAGPVGAEDSQSAATSTLRPVATSAATPANDVQPALRGSSILVIEDDPVFAEVVCDTLHDQGFPSLVAPDGRTGLELARRNLPRGIILDIRLPDIDGLRVMQLLREDPATAAIPVHFVSAADASERAMALGAVGYLPKPASRRELLQVLQAFAPSATRAARVLVIEDDALQADSVVRRLAAEEFTVERAGSASEALEALERTRFQCLVLHLGLPDMDGLEFLRALEQRCGAHMPSVVVYTGRALSKAEVQRIESYADAVVLKDGQGADRLLDEVRLFVRRISDDTPSQRPPAEPQQRLDGLNVLLVDDDMRTVYALSALLRAKGADVRVADTGRVALAELDRHPDIDIVLMDIMMPEMDGYEAMRHIRKDARFLDLPVIALTAKAMKGDREKCLEAGASDYLPKPIDPEKLFALLHARMPLRVEVRHGT